MDCDDVFSDAGSTPAASTIRLGRAADEENGALSEQSERPAADRFVSRRASLMVFDHFFSVDFSLRRWHRRRHLRALLLHLALR